VTTLPGDTVCAGTAVTFTAGSGGGGSSPKYQWKVNGKDVGAGLLSYSYTPVDGDVVGVELTSNATCISAPTAFGFAIMTVITPIVPALVLSVDPGVNVPEGGTTVTFTATITNKVPAPTYQWIKNGIPIPGEVNPTYVTTTLVDQDTISCRVYSGGKCSMTAIDRLHMHIYKVGGNENHVGVQNITSADAAIRVLPNPSKGIFTVTGSTGVSVDESVSLEMTNILGQVIYRGTTVAKDGTINEQVQLNGVANGTYLLNVRTAAMHKVFHIIIE
ncbi:MAG: hypothetical protein JWQ38_2205, partial [Flavipsychrobacter sp.]|nr:hypothetical protein [Flavipsychrobacter sp.]